MVRSVAGEVSMEVGSCLGNQYQFPGINSKVYMLQSVSRGVEPVKPVQIRGV